MAVRNAVAASARSPDGGFATVGGTFPDDPPRPPPLRVPETAPEWSPSELERYMHVVAMERHTSHAVRRHDLLERLHGHCDGLGNPNPLLLLGPPGSGKSTALAQLMSEIEAGPAVRRRRSSGARSGAGDGVGADTPSTSSAMTAVDSGALAAGPEPFVLAHTFGVVGHSDDLRRVLLRMCFELKSRFNIYVDLPSRLEDVGTAFPRFLAHAALFGKIIVVLDGLDRAETHNVTPEDWLPAALPLAARVVVASAGCRAVNALREGSGQLLEVVNVTPLSSSERSEVIDSNLKGVGGGRVPASATLGDLIQCEDAGLPLYLSLATTEIKARARVNDGDTYAAVEEANGFPGTVVELLSSVFERLERRFGTALVAEATTLIATSFAGLQEHEILYMLKQTPALVNLPQSEWEALSYELEPLCWPVDRLPGVPAMVFFHTPVKTAVLRRFADAAAERRQQHLRVAQFFSAEDLEPTHRGVGEVLWGLREGHDWDALRACLTDPNVHAHMWNQDTQVDLSTHWDVLLKGEQRVANARNQKLVPGPNGAMVLPKPRPPRRRLDCTKEFVTVADVTPVSSDGILTPDVTKELLADFLAYAGFPSEAAYVLRQLSDEKGNEADVAAVSINYKLGRALGRQGAHLECEETLRKALAAEQQLVGTETPMVAEIVTELCKVKMETGEVEQAGQLAAHAVSVWEAAEAAGYEEADVATLVESLTRLAEACEVLDRSVAAEAAYERALERLEYMLGPDHPEVAEHLGKMGGAYMAHCEWEKAEFCYCRALAFAHRFTGPCSLHISHFYNVLAELHRARGDTSQAQALYQRALQVIERVLGTNHPEVATYLNNLAETLRARGRLQDAEPMYVRALAIDESTQGVSHPIVAIRLNNLAELFRDMERMEDAEPLYQRALAIDMAALGPNHPNVATYLNNLAGLYKAREMWDKAAEHYTRAIAIDERALGPDHPDVAIYLNNLAGLHKARGRLDDAEPLYLRALRINEEALGGDHGDMAIYFNNIALLYKAQGKTSEAKAYYQMAIDIGEKTLGESHPQVAARLCNLGALLVDMGDFDGADVVFQRALVIRRDAFGDENEDTRNTKEWIAHITERRAGAVRSLPHKQVSLNVPTVDDRDAGVAAEATSVSFSEPSPPLMSVERKRESPPRTPPMFDVTTPVAAPPISTTASFLAPPPTQEAARGDARSTPAQASPARVAKTQSPLAQRGTGGTTPRTTEAMSSQLYTSNEAVDAAMSSVDALLSRYASQEKIPDPPKSPFNNQTEAAIIQKAQNTLPAIFTRGASPAATPRHSKNWSAFPEGAEGAGGIGGQSIRDNRIRANCDADAWDQEVDAAPGLAETALDAFLSTHVEYLGNRQYRCVLDGKVLSKFSIMRVHVARKFAGLVHQWGLDQGSGGVGVGVVHVGSPVANNMQTQESPAPSPNDSNLVDSPHSVMSPQRVTDDHKPPPVLNNHHTQAMKRVEELEEELARMRMAMASGSATANGMSNVNSPNQTQPNQGLPTATLVYHGQQSVMQGNPMLSTPAPFYPYGQQGYGAYPNPGVTPYGAQQYGGYAERGPFQNQSGYHPESFGSAAESAAAMAAHESTQYQQYQAFREFSMGRAPLSRGGSPLTEQGGKEHSKFNPGADFSDMLAKERGPNPFNGFSVLPSFDTQALSPKGIAAHAEPPGTERSTRLEQFDSSFAATPGQTDLGTLLGVGKVDATDVLGLYVAARSQQVARRKFLCEIDGKVFSTMNLMRVHFERHYQQDAEQWWARHKKVDDSLR